MAHTFGSLRFSTSGRRRKALPKTKAYTPKFQEIETIDTYRRDTIQYRSASDLGGDCSVVDRSDLVAAATFTIAPAYNKGAYQVISSENIKDIGR
tara:strand:+ start:932 stop:1216 length:285 start_codon:yes stop_codon:yes gene_type:complete